jgi:hypothetical protein
LIIADDCLSRKCGSVSICTAFIQTERLFTNQSAAIPLLHARAENIYELAACLARNMPGGVRLDDLLKGPLGGLLRGGQGAGTAVGL